MENTLTPLFEERFTSRALYLNNYLNNTPLSHTLIGCALISRRIMYIVSKTILHKL